MHACDGGAHRFGRTAEHVDVRVVNGHVPFRRYSVDFHFARATAGRLVLGYDVGPQHTCGAELRDLHEIIRADRHRKADRRSRLVDREPLLHQFYDIFVAYGQREGQFLDDRRTAVVELLAVDADEADAFVLRNLFNQVGNCGESFGGTFFASQFAFEREFVGQSPMENRTITETLDIGWKLLGLLPKEELDRIDTKVLNQYYQPTDIDLVEQAVSDAQSMME